MKSRVADIVEESGYDVTERDELFPAAGHRVGDAQTIVLRRGRPLQISLDGREPRQVWTTAATVDSWGVWYFAWTQDHELSTQLEHGDAKRRKIFAS